MMTKRKILLVDDDINLLAMLADFLEGEGYEVEKADSGEQALAHLRTDTPDLIVLDMMMPGIGGMGVLDRLILPDGTFRYPILVLTAKAAMSEYFADKQIDGFLAKPCDPEDLALEVGRIIFQSAAEKKPVAEEKPLIYLADGQESRRMTLAGALERDGYSVMQCASGADLIQATVLVPPVMIVMALELGDQSAGSVVTLIRSMTSTARVKVVVYGLGLPGAKLDDVLAVDSRACHAISGDSELDVLTAVSGEMLRV